MCFIYLQKVVCGIDASRIRGVGFDATCSLVVVDKQFQPLAVNSEGRTPAQKLVLAAMQLNLVSSKDRVMGLNLEGRMSFLLKDFFLFLFL